MFVVGIVPKSGFFAYHPRAEERSGARALRMTRLWARCGLADFEHAVEGYAGPVFYVVGDLDAVDYAAFD